MILKEKRRRMDIVTGFITVIQPMIIKNSKNIALQNMSGKPGIIIIRDNFVVYNQ